MRICSHTPSSLFLRRGAWDRMIPDHKINDSRPQMIPKIDCKINDPQKGPQMIPKCKINNPQLQTFRLNWTKLQHAVVDIDDISQFQYPQLPDFFWNGEFWICSGVTPALENSDIGTKNYWSVWKFQTSLKI